MSDKPQPPDPTAREQLIADAISNSTVVICISLWVISLSIAVATIFIVRQ